LGAWLSGDWVDSSDLRPQLETRTYETETRKVLHETEAENETSNYCETETEKKNVASRDILGNRLSYTFCFEFAVIQYRRSDIVLSFV